jgi:c-di-GMP-binding flagellar brake protein YcgR
MDVDKIETDSGIDINVNIIRIKKNEIIDQIIHNALTSNIELGITVFPQGQFFKSYFIETKSKYLIIDSLMPFYGNKILPKTEHLKINMKANNQIADKYFVSKYKDEITSGDESNFLIYKPQEIVIVEKRSVLRVSTDKYNAAFIIGKYQNNDFFYPLYDLSWNGISFNSDVKMEQGNNTIVKFLDKIIHMDLKIIHSTYINNDGKFRIGCYINNISEKDRDILINFILSIERQNIKNAD